MLAFWHECHSYSLLNKCWLLYTELSQTGFKELKHKKVLKKGKTGKNLKRFFSQPQAPEQNQLYQSNGMLGGSQEQVRQ